MTGNNKNQDNEVNDNMTKIYRVGRFISNATEVLVIGFAPFFLTILEVFIAYNEANVIATLQPMNKAAFWEAIGVTFIGMFTGILFPSQISQAWQLNRHIKLSKDASTNAQFNEEYLHRLRGGRRRFLIVGIGSLIAALTCHIMTIYFVTVAAQSEDILNIIMIKAQQDTGLVYQFTDSFGVAQGIITLAYVLAVVAFVLDILLGSVTSVQVNIADFYPREAADKLQTIKVAEGYLEDSIQRVKLLEDTLSKLTDLQKRTISLNSKINTYDGHKNDMEQMANDAAEVEYQKQIKDFVKKDTLQGHLFKDKKDGEVEKLPRETKRAEANDKALEVKKPTGLDRFKKDDSPGKTKAAENAMDELLSGDMNIDVESINSKAVGDLVAEFYKRYGITVENYHEVIADLDARNNETLMTDFTSAFRDQMDLWKRIRVKDIGAPEGSKEYKETLAAMINKYETLKQQVIVHLKEMGFKMEYEGETGQ